MRLFLADVGLIVSLSGLVGVWVARASARSALNDVTTAMTHALQTVDNGLGRANDQAQGARQTITQVNDAAAKLGDRVQASSPLITKLNQLVGNDLAPRIEKRARRPLPFTTPLFLLTARW